MLRRRRILLVKDGTVEEAHLCSCANNVILIFLSQVFRRVTFITLLVYEGYPNTLQRIDAIQLFVEEASLLTILLHHNESKAFLLIPVLDDAEVATFVGEDKLGDMLFFADFLRSIAFVSGFDDERDELVGEGIDAAEFSLVGEEIVATYAASLDATVSKALTVFSGLPTAFIKAITAHDVLQAVSV